ncbi:MAG: hypothetical protein EOO38_22515, partial [Cytophagaceae bacterium]
MMSIFSYASWGIDTTTGFDPNKTFVRSHFVSPMVLACIRAVLCIYSFTTIITCYTWLAHRTATISLKDVNIGSYTIHQSEDAIGQSFSKLSRVAIVCETFTDVVHLFRLLHVPHLLVARLLLPHLKHPHLHVC